MKKTFNILVLLVICFCSLHSIFGQSSADSDKTFKELFYNSQKLRADKSYRIKKTIEIYDDNVTTLKTKIVSISETVPPDRWHNYSSYESGGVTKKGESISIGEKVFIKENDEAWKIDDSKSEVFNGIGMSKGGKFIEKATFNGQTVVVYEEESSHSSKMGDRNAKTRYWFNEEGYLLKSESEETDLKTKEIFRIVAIYEYDPTIKIEAPIKP